VMGLVSRRRPTDGRYGTPHRSGWRPGRGRPR
jgi:hypothetical protein